MKNTCLFLLFLLPATVFAQMPGMSYAPFQTDTSVLSEIKRYHAESLGQMDVRMYGDDSLLLNTFDSTRRVQIMLHPFWNTDTLFVMGIAGMFSGFGFVLAITKDEAAIFNFIATDGPEVYKLNVQDSTYRGGLFVPCTFERLTLNALPRYETGEKIAGVVELSGVDFYQKKNFGEGDNRYRMDLKAFFQFEVPERK